MLISPLDVLNIVPIPSNGWVFSRWDYDGSDGITELSGGVLNVEMSVDRTNITAIFEEKSTTDSIKDETSVMFYCPSETFKDNVVSFNFTNSSDNPSVGNTYHFRLNFYTDVLKSKLVYSVFSASEILASIISLASSLVRMAFSNGLRGWLCIKSLPSRSSNRLMALM